MQVSCLGQARTEAPTVFMDSPRGRCLPARHRAGEMPSPSSPCEGEVVLPKHGAGFIRRRCERVAEHIRSSTGVVHYESSRKCSAGEDTPWLRLLLWVFACAALLVSLIIRADGLDHRDPESAVRAAVSEGPSETGLPMLGSTIQGGEAGAWSLRSGPRS